MNVPPCFQQSLVRATAHKKISLARRTFKQYNLNKLNVLFTLDMAACTICLELFLENEKSTTLTQKGVDGIIKANDYNEEKIFPSIGDKVIWKIILAYIL